MQYPRVNNVQSAFPVQCWYKYDGRDASRL